MNQLSSSFSVSGISACVIVYLNGFLVCSKVGWRARPKSQSGVDRQLACFRMTKSDCIIDISMDPQMDP